MGGGGDAVGVVVRQLNGPIVAHGVDDLYMEGTTSTLPDTHNHSTSGACRHHQVAEDEGRRGRLPEDMRWRVACYETALLVRALFYSSSAGRPLSPPTLCPLLLVSSGSWVGCRGIFVGCSSGSSSSRSAGGYMGLMTYPPGCPAGN